MHTVRLNTKLGMLDFEKPTKSQEGDLLGPITCVRCDKNTVNGHVVLNKFNKYQVTLRCDECGEEYNV